MATIARRVKARREAVIQGEKVESILDSMSTNQEIGEYTPLAGPGLFSSARDIKLECPASSAPGDFS
jgi:hypothetical protein